MKILVIEDEQKLAGFIVDGLRQSGNLVQWVADGPKGMERAASEDFDLILLDLMLPGANGFEVLKNLRAFRVQTPVIILSALGETEHVVNGLDLGAVDYIRKPFEWEELLARIRTVERKISGNGGMKIRVDDLEIDLVGRKVSRDGKEIDLTAREFVLLEYLARNANRIMSRSQIIDNVWEMDFDPDSNIVEVYIYQLRKKIDKGFGQPLLRTVVGAGYQLKGERSGA
jgi:two-component system copper resistance phosphate regulon response regulator CusR